MRSRLEDTFHRLLWRFGVDLKRMTPLQDPHLRRAGLMEAEGIDGVIDGGANVGQFGHALRRYGYRGPILSLEPGSAAFAALQKRCAKDSSWEARRTALGATGGEASLGLSANSISSSLLEPTEEMRAALPSCALTGRETTPLVRLDEIEPMALPSSERLLVKLDVQGAEREALEGAVETLRRARLVELEVPLAPLYSGQASWKELGATLEAAGFVLVSVTPNTLDPANGRLLEVDAIYARQDGA
jgi:FkbM family methyltransferase